MTFNKFILNPERSDQSIYAWLKDELSRLVSITTINTLLAGIVQEKSIVDEDNKVSISLSSYSLEQRFHIKEFLNNAEVVIRSTNIADGLIIRITAAGTYKITYNGIEVKTVSTTGYSQIQLMAVITDGDVTFVEL